MKDYIVESNVKISFMSTIYLKGTDAFDAEAKIERVIRDVILGDKILNCLVDSDKPIDLKVRFRTYDYKE